MPVGLSAPRDLLPVSGVRLATAEAGIRYAGRRDLTLIHLDPGTRVAGVFTRNRFRAAPVLVAEAHLAAGREIRALVINTGNANAGTGETGLRSAQESCEAVALALGCTSGQVLPFSTGVIGEPVDLAARIRGALPGCVPALDRNGWNGAAQAILTTDTVAKAFSRQVEVDGRPVTVTGMAKGSGMIRPDMATMLAFIATDAAVEKAALDELLHRAVDASFNRITVDGDMSTNDACILMATGQAGNGPVESGSAGFGRLREAVQEVALALAQAIVRDGEGATKFIPVRVSGGKNPAECLQVAYRMAHSPLIKTAFFASDPNWGRLLAAIGSAGVEDLDVRQVQISLGGLCIVRQGARDPAYTEAAGQAVMAREEIPVHVDLGRGTAEEEIWTCDLSHEYVRINAEYRS